jgi:hypothetical protein
MTDPNHTATPQTWRDVQKSKPDPIACALAAWHATRYKSEHIRMVDAIDAYEAALEVSRQCDEPGCTKESSCGFPVEGGYRRTCYDHSVFKKATNNVPG